MNDLRKLLLRVEPGLLALALLGPTAAAWWYFVLLEGEPAARWAYLGCKLVQFLLPLTALPLWRAAAAPLERGDRRSSLGLGLLSGLMLALPLLAVYELFLHDSALARQVAPAVSERMNDFGVGHPSSYLLFALLLSLGHSGLEELYWRWFVFSRLRERLGFKAGLSISSLGFMAHHVIAVSAFLERLDGSRHGWLLLTFSLGVAAAGAVWAWLYAASGRLLTPWISHAFADLAVMAVGARLVFG